MKGDNFVNGKGCCDDGGGEFVGEGSDGDSANVESRTSTVLSSIFEDLYFNFLKSINMKTQSKLKHGPF